MKKGESWEVKGSRRKQRLNIILNLINETFDKKSFSVQNYLSKHWAYHCSKCPRIMLKRRIKTNVKIIER